MKSIAKTSLLSILCAVAVSPVFGAASVRSLGGRGTYVGTTSAVSAKTGSTAAKTDATKTDATTSGTRTTSAVTTGATRTGVVGARLPSTRAASTPRLSLGKYLSKNSATGGAISTIKPGQSTDNSTSQDYENRFQELEDKIADFESGVDVLEFDVETLRQDLVSLTGKEFAVSYSDDGVLTISQGGQEIVSEEFLTMDDLNSVEDALNSTMISYIEAAIAAEAAARAVAISDSLLSAKGYTDTEVAALYNRIIGEGGVASDEAVAENARKIEGLRELLGDSSVAVQISDALSAYTPTADINEALLQKQNRLNPGRFIDIAADGTISTTLTGSDSITISEDGKISVGAILGAMIADGSVTTKKLAENAVTNAVVADGALNMAKIDGLETELQDKLTIPELTSEADGKYVLTATAADGTATYYWELINRGTDEGESDVEQGI